MPCNDSLVFQNYLNQFLTLLQSESDVHFNWPLSSTWPEFEPKTKTHRQFRERHNFGELFSALYYLYKLVIVSSYSYYTSKLNEGISEGKSVVDFM